MTANPNVDSLLARAEDLQMFPNSVAEIRAVVEDDSSSMADLERAVELDPALSAHVLRMANSPYFGAQRKVVDLRQALSMLGFRATRDIAIALAVLSMAQRSRRTLPDLLVHSLESGYCARRIVGEVAPAFAGEAFVAGLLHDIGELVVALTVPSVYAQLRPSCSDEARVRAERAELGIDHAELGAACLERWGLSERTCTAVRLHHRPEDAAGLDRTTVQLTCAVTLADRLTRSPARDDLCDDEWPGCLLEGPAGTLLGLGDDASARTLLSTLVREAPEAARVLAL